jgi:hypothetical protein
MRYECLYSSSDRMGPIQPDEVSRRPIRRCGQGVRATETVDQRWI